MQIAKSNHTAFFLRWSIVKLSYRLFNPIDHVYNVTFRSTDPLATIDITIVYLVVGVIVAILGGAIGLKLASRMGSNMEREQLTDTVGFLQKELKKSKGTIGQQQQGPTVPEGTELNEDNFDGIIRGLISKYSGMAPKRFQFLLQDPAIVNFLISEAKKNPEQTKEVLKHFIGGNGIADKGSSDTKTKELEQFIEGGA